jgi:Arc/MetJ family transcription regulator
MRTTIVIDDRLMKRAMRAAGTATKRATVERGLQLLVQLFEAAPSVPTQNQKNIRTARGKLPWEGDLDAMRRDH